MNISTNPNASTENSKYELSTHNYIASIFLYNSELWTLTETLQNSIDSFHRKIYYVE